MATTVSVLRMQDTLGSGIQHGLSSSQSMQSPAKSPGSHSAMLPLRLSAWPKSQCAIHDKHHPPCLCPSPIWAVLRPACLLPASCLLR